MQAAPETSLVGEEYEVEVGPVAHGGHCIARTDEGQVLFVRHALPGERVVARVTEGEEGSRFLRADAVRDPRRPPRTASRRPARTPAPAGAAAATGSTPSRAPSAASRARSSPSSCSGSRASPPRRPAGTARSMPRRGRQAARGRGAGVAHARPVRGRRRGPRGAAQAPLARGRADRPLHDRRARGHRTGHREARLAADGVGRGDRRHRLAATARSILTPRPGAPAADRRARQAGLRPAGRARRTSGVHRVHGRPFVRERADDRTYRVGNGGFWQVHPKAADTLVEAVMQGLLPAQGRHGPRPVLRRRPLRRRPRRPRRRARARSSASSPASAPSRTPATTSRTSTASASNRARSSRSCPRTGITEVDLIVLDPPRAGAGKKTVEHLVVPGRPPHRVRGLRPGGAGAGLGVLPRGRVRAADAAGVRPVSDDASCGVRGDPGAGGEGLLTCGFARAHYVRCGRYGRYLDAEMTLVTLI